jgi:Ca2+:H+ antiporter
MKRSTLTKQWTAFHASFSLENQDEADARVLKLSRGTSIILLITYLVYLAFQLKSHAYLYQGTPQHIIDRETEPGLLQRMNSTSSSSTSSSSSASNASGSRRRISKRLRSKLGRKRQEKVEFSEEPEELDTITEEKGKERSATPSSLPKSNTESLPLPPQTPKAAIPADEKTHRPGLGPKGLSIIAPPVFRSSTNPMSDRPEGRLRRLKSAPNREAMWLDEDPSKITPAARVNSTRSVKTEVEEPPIDQTTSIILLLISTGLVALCAEFLVGSIQHLVENSSLSEAFIGLIILPIVGNAAEHVTAVTVAAKNKLDLALGVALGSSIQIALFVTPLVVVIGWIMDKEMSLYFNLFETVTIFVSTFVVNFLVLDGRSNYLEGFLLCISYVIIG